MSEGLSQDDFRKLLATPRRSNPENDNNDSQQQNKFKVPAPKTPKSTGAIFAKPRSVGKKNFKKNSKKNQGDEDDDDDEEEDNKSNYRDRAAERRQQEQGDAGSSSADTAVDDSQLTTEELLKRTQLEVDQELDAKQLYEQSKYLGGDVDHTHLVKGLDFALLQKVRTDLVNRKNTRQQNRNEDEDEEEEDESDEEEGRQPMDTTDDLDQILEKFERGENITSANDEQQENKPKFRTVIAKNIYEQIKPADTEQRRVELFEPGRMAYVFELTDEVGHYSDASAIPTAVIRSKADVSAKLARMGWTEDTQAETNLVIDKVAAVMARVRRGDRGISDSNKTAITDERRHAASVITKSAPSTTSITSQPLAMLEEDGFMGDIFADAGRDYQLDESSDATAVTEATEGGISLTAEKEEANSKKANYFTGLIEEDEEMEEATNNNDSAVNALLSQATKGTSIDQTATDDEKQPQAKKARYSNTDIDADAADIDMFGLSSSALPTSFEERNSKHATTAYQSDDDDEEGENESSNEKKKNTQLIDQGTNRNKKAQLTRWDFDTEEEWQNYKDTIEIHPKSAFQFGVKLGDGRKRNRERKGMSDKQRSDRDYQQVKNIMNKKYGKSLEDK